MAHPPGGVRTGVTLLFRAKGPRNPQDNGTLATQTHTSRRRYDDAFAQLRVPRRPTRTRTSTRQSGEHEAARRELPGQRATDLDLTPAGG
jgi:hypothetical protein